MGILSLSGFGCWLVVCWVFLFCFCLARSLEERYKMYASDPKSITAKSLLTPAISPYLKGGTV